MGADQHTGSFHATSRRDRVSTDLSERHGLERPTDRGVGRRALYLHRGRGPATRHGGVRGGFASWKRRHPQSPGSCGRRALCVLHGLRTAFGSAAGGTTGSDGSLDLRHASGYGHDRRRAGAESVQRPCARVCGIVPVQYRRACASKRDNFAG